MVRGREALRCAVKHLHRMLRLQPRRFERLSRESALVRAFVGEVTCPDFDYDHFENIVLVSCHRKKYHYSFPTTAATVLVAKRAMLARMSSADFVHTKGFGESL